LGLKGKEGTLLLLGLDNAGKTTLLHRLRTGGVRNFPPTDRPTSERFTIQGITFCAWDLGGHEAVRHLWQDYVCECKAILFLVDASDSERIEEVGYELDALIAEKVVEHLPIAILFNKCDLAEAMSSEEMCQRIQYSDLEIMQGPEKMASFRISVLRGEGYQEAFRWLSTFL
jgi:GTP-binding protein SAR1